MNTDTNQPTRAAQTRDSLALKLARAQVGLAPEDATIGQAEYTAQLRDDPTYADRWLTFHADCSWCGREVDASNLISDAGTEQAGEPICRRCAGTIQSDPTND
jgi:hypothetical protein